MRHTVLCFLAFALSSCSLFQHQPDELDRKIASLIICNFEGESIPENHHIRRDITEYGLGGVVLFDSIKSHPNRNISSPAQLRTLTTDLQAVSKTPLLIAIDQEGGRVARLNSSKGFPSFPSAQNLGQSSLQRASYMASDIATSLKHFGFNLNFAPVADVGVNEQNFIWKKERIFSSDVAEVTAFSKAFMDAHKAEGIIPTLKHFPGHGSSKTDSHAGFVDVSETWSPNELEPFSSLVDDAPVIMTAHIFNKQIDAKHPATLSKLTIQELLRDQLGYQGVVVSDDLFMGAIKENYSLEESLKLSLNAGVDLLLFVQNDSYDKNLVPKVVRTVRKLILNKEVSYLRVEEAFLRVQALKATLK